MQARHANHHEQLIEQWRAGRLKRLTADNGWLTLVGLPWLQEGANRVGSAPDNDIVIATAPAHLGTVQWHPDGTVAFALAVQAEASIDGGDARQTTLLDDSHALPTTVRFGSTLFYLITRDGRKGLRVKDSQATTRTQFAGLAHFPVNPSLRVTARWEAFEPPHTLEMGNKIGGIDAYPVPGRAVFEVDGETFSLLPVIEEPGDTQYFVVFADATSGKDTYGAGRFLYIDPPAPGADTVVIDFNMAYNPPCVFTPFATCPLAPPENRLGFRVEAGEMNYAGPEA